MEETPLVQYQVLTKRPIRARKILVDRYGNSGVPANFWIGVSCEDNRVAARLNILPRVDQGAHRRHHDGVRLVSVEPIIGPTDALDFSGIRLGDLRWRGRGGARVMQPEWLLTGIEHAKAAGAAIWLKQHGQMRSNPLLHHAPPGLGLTEKFKWLIANGLEVLPHEKGGATLEDKVTWREFPAQYHAAKAALNVKPI